MSKLSRIVIYGGKGALGSKAVTHFKSKGWWVCSIDLTPNNEADFNVSVTETSTLPQQEDQVLSLLVLELHDTKLDAIICVAGGWEPGNATKDFVRITDLMWKQNVWTSIIAASMAAKYLKEDGLLVLSGAEVALNETPDMIGYGLAKAAVHHLTKSIAGNNARYVQFGTGFPSGAICVAILPTILKTPLTRDWMFGTITSCWTPIEIVVDLLWKWSNNEDRPDNGSLLQLVTNNYNTHILPSTKFKIHIVRKHDITIGNSVLDLI